MTIRRSVIPLRERQLIPIYREHGSWCRFFENILTALIRIWYR